MCFFFSMTKEIPGKSTFWSGIHVTEEQKCGQTQSHAVSFLEEVKHVNLTLNFSVIRCLICVNIMSNTSLWHFHCTLFNDWLLFGTL